MKTKEEIIAVIEKIKSLNIALSVADYEAVLHYLKLSSLNPMKIDEERMESILIGIGGDAYYKNQTRKAIKIYNSTLENHQVLQPLSSEMPKWFRYSYGSSDARFVWERVVSLFGTPTKKELVSVEEFRNKIIDLRNEAHVNCQEEFKNAINQVINIIDTYSLNPPKREWWMDLKEGDKFMWKGQIKTFRSYEVEHKLYIDKFPSMTYCPANDCTPYIEPSIHDKVKEKLGTELYEEFMKEVKNG